MKYARAAHAKGRCDRCGFTYLLSQLKPEVNDGRKTGAKVCPSCLDPDHPLNKRGRYRYDDPETLRDPRYDADQQTATSYFGFDPIGGIGLRMAVELGHIDVIVGA